MATKNQDQATSQETAVASDQQNDRLEHSQGGITTRDDATDVGVPMLAGDASEPVGPEDAAGGQTRGDYSGRVESGYHPHTSEPVPNAKPGEAQTRLVPQRPMFSQTAEVKGKKGGVAPETRN